MHEEALHGWLLRRRRVRCNLSVSSVAPWWFFWDLCQSGAGF